MWLLTHSTPSQVSSGAGSGPATVPSFSGSQGMECGQPLTTGLEQAQLLLPGRMDVAQAPPASPSRCLCLVILSHEKQITADGISRRKKTRLLP